MSKRVGQYQLQSEIGRGQFGIVYKGTHIPSNAEVAIKMIPRSRLTPETQTYLDQEISILRSVDSKYIMKLYDVQKTGSNFYMILEYWTGGDLGKFIKENGPVSEAVAKNWFSQLMEAFKWLNRKNIIHRDLKLANIMLSEASTNAEVKLGDFGLARHVTGLASTYWGTPLNMAPEVFDHNKYDSKADIWSLGTVLYEMMHGKSPFIVKNAEELRQAQKEEMKFGPGVSPAWADLLTRMLQHDPQKRISFEELFEANFLSFSKTSSEDYDILQFSDKDNQFIWLSPVKSPMGEFFDLEEERGQLVTKVAQAEWVATFAEKLLARQEQLSACALFAKSALILNSVLEHCIALITRHNLSQSLDFEFYNDYETYKANFESKTARLEYLSQDIDSYVVNIEQYGSAGYAESLIYSYALSLGKEAAQDEYIRHFKRAYERYEECIMLLKAIEDSADSSQMEASPEGWQVLISVRQEAEKRFQSVKLQV